MALFNLPPRATKGGDSLLAKKASSKAKPSNAGISIKGGGGLLERISTITALVNKNLGKYKEKYDAIREEPLLIDYVSECIKNGIVAIDTETSNTDGSTGVPDPLTCRIAGFSLYTPNKKACYIPLHHVSYVTGVEVEGQLSEDVVARELQRLQDAKVKVIMFNGKYDSRVIHHCLGVKLDIHWDAYIGARLLNENEPNNQLKVLHQKYVLNGEGDAWTFSDLFKGIPFSHIPINVGYLYAARDAEVTFELYEFQKPFLTEDDPICIERGLTGVAYVFNKIEIPLIPITAAMEDTGVEFDFEYANELSKKYNQILVEKTEFFYSIVDTYAKKIEDYRRKQGGSCKLGSPINIASPTQVAILIYDILGIKPPDKKNPRGTGEEVLSQIDHPIAKAILDYRGVEKLLSTYIDKFPNIAHADGRIHASFNQLGTDTGRYSSSEPNLQNIPSHNTDVRKMFKASDGHVLISCDYSAQEPRLTSHLSEDEKMIQAYVMGKDLYVEIASLAFDLPYDECKEFRDDGTRNPEGKERRGQAKAIVLGVCYGKGIPAIAEDLKVPVKKAQEIYDRVMKSFPGLKKFMEDSQQMAMDYGYVTTAWGRKRRLPNIQLPPYEFSYVGGGPKDFDPLFDDEEEEDMGVSQTTIEKYTRLLDRCYSRKEKEEIKAKAKAEGILIKDNGGFIAEAVRQCVNSRVQGSAADLTKIAMLLIGNDERLKNLGFKLLLPVHDELIGECPRENVAQVAPIFESLMVKAGEGLKVPLKCDTEITERWYGEPLEIL